MQDCFVPVVKVVQHQMEAQPLTEWSSGLCDCFEDASTCCYGFWCCPFLACTVSERFGENRCLPLCDMCSGPAVKVACLIPVCVPPPALLSLRVAMRNRYGIKGSLCKDILATSCCEWCAWCQMHRELKHRRKTPTVINVPNQTIVQIQPSTAMMAPAYPPQAGFVSEDVSPETAFLSQPEHAVKSY